MKIVNIHGENLFNDSGNSNEIFRKDFTHSLADTLFEKPQVLELIIYFPKGVSICGKLGLLECRFTFYCGGGGGWLCLEKPNTRGLGGVS